MTRKHLQTILLCFALCSAFMIIAVPNVRAQVSGSQQQEIKWLNVGALHHWFSSGGAEIEYGRRGRTGFLTQDQLDGLNWPGEYTVNKGVSTGKSLWIGTTDYLDPVTGKTYAHKVVNDGRINMYLGSEIFADELKLIGKTDHPSVYVDDARASDREYDDVVDKVDPTLPADRMIINRFHTSIGISVTRKIYAYSQQYNDNYYIYEYVFKNNGIIDATNAKKLNKTLTGVVFHFQHRYGFAGESYLPQNAWAPTGASWGLNTINDCIGQDAKHPGDFRAIWSYYGPVSTAPSLADDIGLPRYTNGSILAGTNFAGIVVLHADKSTTDHSDDPLQPKSTMFQPSDRGAQLVDQYEPNIMTQKYTNYMTAGHPAQTHAEQVGKDANGWPTVQAANTWGGDAGGYASTQSFGPYTMAIGDSIKIVYAEAVAGIMSNRDKVREIAGKWFNRTTPYVLPNGSTTTDRNIYKNTWVFSGKDSLFQTFRRALTAYKNNFNIPQAPPPPSQFKVNSGGNKIALSWANNATTWPNFDGYRIYRAVGRADSTFDMIFQCGKNDVVHSFDDKTAKRGFNYFYYIQTKDNGSTNTVRPGVPLVSSKYLTVTNKEAFLTRPPGNNLSGIRIVPNPYNIKAREIQFGVDAPDRLAFYGLPPMCRIKIFTETGQLVETIEHTNGSGDELWHSLTSSRQLVVSGLYLAHFEVTQDAYDDATGKLLFKQGESVIKKFIVIR